MRSHHNTRRVFEDFLTMAVCSLAGGTMEAEYLEAAQRYSEGEKGRRAIDEIPRAYAELIEAMETTRKDILGDIFMGGVTFGESGQFYTPECICTMMAQMQFEAEATGKRVMDACCGSGRMLLAVADINPRNEFYGVDIDLRCVRMTAINLALRNLYGWVICGDALRNEQRRIFRTGFNGRGFIAEVEPEATPETVRIAVEFKSTEDTPGKQLMLF
jgi:type I restriction-modification system DNA methylase subunit